MLSIETESKLSNIFLALAEGEKSIDINRQILAELNDFDPFQIFSYLDTQHKNHIDSSDLLNYLQERGIFSNEIEIKLIILFYDRDYDGVLSFPEFNNLLQSEFSKKKNISNDSQKIILNLPKNIDQALRQLLANEVELAKKIIFLLDDLKRRYDFNIHDLYHSVKNWNNIEENSLRNFFGRNKISYLESDIRNIMKRLDFNADGKIDFCEFHVFLGFPNCQICCPNDACSFCGICCCDLCINDSPCPIHYCIHDGANRQNNNQENNIENNIENNLNYQEENKENNLNLNNMEYQNNNQINKINPIPVPKTLEQRSKTPLMNFNYEDDELKKDLLNENKIKKINNLKNNQNLIKNNLNFNKYKNMENPNQEDIENYNFNYCNDLPQSDSSNSFLGKVSDNLVLRASPKRKYSPKVFHCNPYPCNISHSNDYCCNFIYNPEPCEKCIKNHCSLCHQEISPPIYNNICNVNDYRQCQFCHNFPCCCCSICHTYPCECKCCPICHSVKCKCCPKCNTFPCKCCPKCNTIPCKCCPKCNTFPCKCCPVCHSRECICCPNCKKYPCKCCPECHLEECCCCKICHKYPCICCPTCHFEKCRCCTVCKNYPCVCCPVCHMAKCICCQNCKSYPCRCCPDCHYVNCRCCVECGAYPCRCCNINYNNCCHMCDNMNCHNCNNNCGHMCENLKCKNCNSNPCICCPYCNFNQNQCHGCTCSKECLALSLKAMNCPMHNVHTMKHNEGCPFLPKCLHEPKCAHPKKKDNNINNSNSSELNNDYQNNSQNNNPNNSFNNDNPNNIFNNNNPNNGFNNNSPNNSQSDNNQNSSQNNNSPYNIVNNKGPYNKICPNDNCPYERNRANFNNNKKITYTYNDNSDMNDNDSYNNISDINEPNNINPNDNNKPFNQNDENDINPDDNNYPKDQNIPYQNPNDSNRFNPNDNNRFNPNDNNRFNPNDNNRLNPNDNNRFNPNDNNRFNPNDNNRLNPNDNNRLNPNENIPDNQNKNIPISPISSVFPPELNQLGQKNNWIFCPKCNLYHRCPHPGCEHNPNTRTTTHKCIHDDENPNQNQSDSQQNINPNFIGNKPINFPNKNFSFSPNKSLSQSQRKKKPPSRKRDVFSSCPYQEELGQFVDFLGYLMEVESRIEDMKIELARRDDFNFEDIFRIFEVEGKGYIEPEDLKQGLKLLGLNPSDFDIKLLMKRFDLNRQGLLTYSDFFDMVVSFEKKLRNSVQIRPPNSCCSCKSPDVFECDTLIAIKNLFKFIIECERDINQIRADFDSLRSKYSDVVQFLDSSRRGYINRSDLKLYLTQFNKFTTSKECDLLFIRLDKLRKGEVGIDEIENELMFLR